MNIRKEYKVSSIFVGSALFANRTLVAGEPFSFSSRALEQFIAHTLFVVHAKLDVAGVELQCDPIFETRQSVFAKEIFRCYFSIMR